MANPFSLPRLPVPQELGGAQRLFLNEHPSAAVDYMLGLMGRTSSPFRDYIRSRTPYFSSLYLMANAANPGLDIVDFLSPELFRREFTMAAPYQRGERMNAFAPRLTFQRY